MRLTTSQSRTLDQSSMDFLHTGTVKSRMVHLWFRADAVA